MSGELGPIVPPIPTGTRREVLGSLGLPDEAITTPEPVFLHPDGNDSVLERVEQNATDEEVVTADKIQDETPATSNISQDAGLRAGVTRRALLGLNHRALDESFDIDAAGKRSRHVRRLTAGVAGVVAIAAGVTLLGSRSSVGEDADAQEVSPRSTVDTSASTVMLSVQPEELSLTLAPLPNPETIPSTTTAPSTTIPKTTTTTTTTPTTTTTEVVGAETVSDAPAIQLAAVLPTTEAPYDPYAHGFNCDTEFEVTKDMNASEIAARCEGRNVWLGFELIVGDVISVADMTPPSTPATGSPERGVNSGVRDCAGLATKSVTITEGNFFYDYFMGKGNSSISLTQAQTERLLWGTNFAQRCGINLNNVVAGRTVQLPTDEAELLRIYKSVAAVS